MIARQRTVRERNDSNRAVTGGTEHLGHPEDAVGVRAGANNVITRRPQREPWSVVQTIAIPTERLSPQPLAFNRRPTTCVALQPESDPDQFLDRRAHV